jgi:hypothetical protein
MFLIKDGNCMKAQIVEFIPFRRTNAYERLAAAVIASAAEDWAFGGWDDREEAMLFFLSDAPLLTVRKVAKRRIETRDDDGNEVIIRLHEEYLEVPTFLKTWKEVREHWFHLAGVPIFDKAAILAKLHAYRAKELPRRHARSDSAQAAHNKRKVKVTATGCGK